MKKTNTPLIILLFAILTLFTLNNVAVAQTPNQNIPYSYQFYQKLNSSVYDINSSFHSSIRGFYADDSVLVGQYQSLMKLGVDSLNKRSWIRRKLTDEHLVNFKGDDYHVYLDFLPDFQIGREFEESKKRPG